MKNNKTVLMFMVCTVLCAAVFAQNEGDFKTNGNGTITKYEGWDTRIVIPAQIGGVPVIGIGDRAFKNMGITSVTLPAGIKYIGKEAFHTNKITTLTIPAGVIIDRDAFSNNQLTGLTIGNGCIFPTSNVFRNNNLRNITLGVNIIFKMDTFGVFLFYEYYCNSAKAGTYDATVRYTEKTEGDYRFVETKYGAVIVRYTGNDGNRLIIPGKLGNAVVKGIGGFFMENNRWTGAGAFWNKEISRMQLPDSLIFIGESAFRSNQLTSVTIPNNVIYIGDDAFSDNQLTSVTIPNGVIFLSGFGRMHMSGNQLTSITIPNSVIAIGASAFKGNQLTSVTIPNSVTSIDEHAFTDNGRLTRVTFESADVFLAWQAFTTGGDLDQKYKDGGRGTYTSPQNGTWTKQ
jgi:hypothetical protein